VALADSDTEAADWIAAAIDALEDEGPLLTARQVIELSNGQSLPARYRLPEVIGGARRSRIRISYTHDSRHRLIRVVSMTLSGPAICRSCEVRFKSLGQTDGEGRGPFNPARQPEAVRVEAVRVSGRGLRRLIGFVVSLLPPSQRSRYAEELLAELMELPSGRRRGYAVRLVCQSWQLRRAVINSATGDQLHSQLPSISGQPRSP
jgi:hypothetical protein